MICKHYLKLRLLNQGANVLMSKQRIPASVSCVRFSSQDTTTDDQNDVFDQFIQATQQKNFFKGSSEKKLEENKNANYSFATLLRNSTLMNWGNITEPFVTTGTIVNVMVDDLYIDFGGKFLCVCRRPREKAEHYVRHAKVLLKINDLELSTRFLGSETDMTLMEADGNIVKLLQSPTLETKDSTSKQKNLLANKNAGHDEEDKEVVPDNRLIN